MTGTSKYGFLFFMAILVSLSCGRKNDEDDVIARVGNAELTRSYLKERLVWEGMDSLQESDFVERWVNRELLYQEAKRIKLDQESHLKWELDLVEKEFLVNQLLERTFEEKVRVTEEEVQSFYEKNQDLFIVQKDEIHAFHILTETVTEANLARQALQAGQPFEDVAKELSKGQFSEKGGDMGWFTRDDVIANVGRVAFSMRLDRVSNPVQSDQGFHLIKTIAKRSAGDVKPLEDVRGDIIQRIRVTKERSVYFDLLHQLQPKNSVYVATPNQLSRRR